MRAIPSSQTELSEDEPLQEELILAEPDTILRLAVVLSDIYSSKDMEFCRGLLLGIQDSQLPHYSISLKIVNGDIPQDSLWSELSGFDPQLIISTYEKNHPMAMTQYAARFRSKIMNVFDARNDDYLRTPGSYQLLIPSETFNENITRYFTENHADDTLVLVGDPDFSDLMLRNLVIAWPEEQLLILSVSELAKLPLMDDGHYIFLPIPLEQKEIKNIYGEISKLQQETPTAEICVLGRPNWISFNDVASMVSAVDTYIPAKCYFDPQSDSGKRIINSYKNTYGHSPIKSFPTFAVMGYDTAIYFLPGFIAELKNEEYPWQPENMVQSYFDMSRSGNAGYYNHGSLMLRFRPWGSMQKVAVN